MNSGRSAAHVLSKTTGTIKPVSCSPHNQADAGQPARKHVELRLHSHVLDRLSNVVLYSAGTPPEIREQPKMLETCNGNNVAIPVRLQSRLTVGCRIRPTKGSIGRRTSPPLQLFLCRQPPMPVAISSATRIAYCLTPRQRRKSTHDPRMASKSKGPDQPIVRRHMKLQSEHKNDTNAQQLF